VFQPIVPPFYRPRGCVYMVTGARQVVPVCYVYPAEFLMLRSAMSSHLCTLYLYPPQQYGAVREVLRRSGVPENVATPPLLALSGPIRRSTRRYGSKGRSGRRVITGGLLRRATVTLPL